MPQFPIPPMVAQAWAESQGRDPYLDEELELLRLEAETAMDIPEPMRAGVAQIQTPPPGVSPPAGSLQQQILETTLGTSDPRAAAARRMLPEHIVGGITAISEAGQRLRQEALRRTGGRPAAVAGLQEVGERLLGGERLRELAPKVAALAGTAPAGAPMKAGEIGAPPAVLAGGQLGPTPGPIQQTMRGLTVSRSGPRRPGELARIAGGVEKLEEERTRQAEEFLAPYQEPAASAEGKLIDPEGPGSRRSLLDEFETLAAKPEKSQAELGRMGQLKDMFAADTAEAKAGEQLRVQQEFERQSGEAEQQWRDRGQEYFEHVEAETGKLAGLQQEFASAEVDPDRLLGSGGKRIMAGIGIALGAMGAALARTPNYAMQVISEAIERDIRAQEANLKKLGARVGMQQSLLGQMRGSFRDEATAAAAARVVLGNVARRKLDSLNLQYAPEERKNQAAALRTALEQKTSDDLQAFQQKSFEGAQRSYQLRANIAAQRGSLAIQRSKAARQAAGAAGPSAPGGLEVVPGRRPTKKDREKSSELMLGYADVQEVLNQARALRDEYGNEWWKVGPAATQGKVIAGQLMLALGKLNGAGANFTEQEMELMGAPENILEVGWVGARLEALEGLVNKRSDAKLRILNFQRQVASRKARAPGE